jgi:hypothetical protein
LEKERLDCIGNPFAFTGGMSQLVEKLLHGVKRNRLAGSPFFSGSEKKNRTLHSSLKTDIKIILKFILNLRFVYDLFEEGII